MKYRKKPVVIDAIQWDGKNVRDIQMFIKDGSWHLVAENGTTNLYISKLTGKMKANIGDYIIKGVNGEFYPCEEDVFLKTYEVVE